VNENYSLDGSNLEKRIESLGLILCSKAFEHVCNIAGQETALVQIKYI